MAGVFRRKPRGDGPTAKTMLAAAMPLVGPEVRRVNLVRRRQTTEAWQSDAWYFYDAVGELRAPINWISNAVSAAVPFAAETDAETGLVTGPSDDMTAQKVAAQLLGGVAKRAQLQYILAVCWQVPGEAFIIIRPTPAGGPDQWLILAGDRVTAKGGVWEYVDPETLDHVQLTARDLLIRVWSPHPRDQAMADTSVRPALPILREIEKSSQNIAARLDSRLAGNGILAFPQEINFPTRGDQSQATAVTAYLMEAAEASLANPGTASAQVPIMLEMPADMIDAFKNGFLDLASNLDEHVVELRHSSLDRLASTLDMPKSVAKGNQDESNHWTAWQVEESTYKIYIEPLLQRLGDALTDFWFRPALALMGVANPERYVIEWDTSEIIARPDQSDTLKTLYDLDLISNEYMRAQFSVPDDAIPSDEELSERRAWQVVQSDATFASQADYAELLGLPEVEIREDAVQPRLDVGVGVDATPAEVQRALPDTQNEERDVSDGLVAAATFVVFDALSRAGGRLLTREHRGQFGHVAKQDLYLTIPYTGGDVSHLLEGSFQNLEGLADGFGLNPQAFSGSVTGYVEYLLSGKRRHDPRTLRRWLAQ